MRAPRKAPRSIQLCTFAEDEDVSADLMADLTRYFETGEITPVPAPRAGNNRKDKMLDINNAETVIM